MNNIELKEAIRKYFVFKIRNCPDIYCRQILKQCDKEISDLIENYQKEDKPNPIKTYKISY